MTDRKGDGVAGGGLKARVAGWESLPGASVAPNHKHATGHDPGNRLYIRPGSQNHRKGGRGK